MLLRGDGEGGFVSMWPAASGLAVAGDATALTVADLNGDDWPDFVVAQNSGKTRAFLNGGRAVNRNHMLKLRLAGSGGNPSGVGAMVRVTLKSGAVRSAEVYAGGGYLSQSAPALFFGLGTGGVVSKIEVRWPSGTATSTRSGPIDRGEVMITQP
ncbi:MAG: CRTAC1 family protein [bacterium]|nr:CRTAC1 family protein [bacterium]